jgi:hypothetical protein
MYSTPGGCWSPREEEEEWGESCRDGKLVRARRGLKRGGGRRGREGIGGGGEGVGRSGEEEREESHAWFWGKDVMVGWDRLG